MRLFFSFLLVISSLFTHAEEAHVNGLYYILNDETNTAMVKNRIDSQFHDYVSSGYTAYSGDIVIPETIMHNGKIYNVTSIEGGYDDAIGLTLFGNTNSLTIPGSITEIGSYAFKSSYNLENIYMTVSNVTSIGTGVFSGRSINELTIEETGEIIGSFGYDINILKLKGKIKEQINRQLSAKTVYIEDIESWCKSGICIPSGHVDFCTGRDPINTFVLYINNELANNVVIPDGVQDIGRGFIGCSNIIQLTCPSSVTVFSPESLVGCDNLTDLYLYSEISPTLNGNYEMISTNRDIRSHTKLHVPDYAIESYKQGDLHHSVYTYWKGFKEIAPIEEIVTDFNLTYFVDGEIYKKEQYNYDEFINPEPDPTKKGMTFSGWSDIPEKMPGKDVTVSGTFSWSRLTKDGVVYQVTDTIKNNAAVRGIDNASGEIDIVSPIKFDNEYSITDIVDFSFKNNTDITSVLIPESVMKIGDEAFYGCKNLAKIELGKSVNQIEPRAFAGIDKLTDITCYAEDVPDADRTAFENSYTEDYVTLHVPASALEKYKNAAPWKNFKEIVAIEGTDAEPTKYTLIYQVDGETYQEYELEEGAEITALEEPTKEGYTFSGWSTIPATMPAEDVIITGTFTKNEPKEEEVDTGEDVIKITSAGQTTWCSKYDLDFTDIEGLKAYIAPGYDRESGTIWLMRVFKVPAGEGILLMGDAKEYKVPHKTTTTYYTNMFVGTTEAKTIYETENGYTNYYLSSGTSGVGFYRVTDADGVQLKANRAYLPLKTSSQASTRGFIGMEFGEDGTTGINRPMLMKKDEWYNLQGRRVESPGKGVYIRNGKKVVTK